MSVRVDENGRRSVQVEVEVTGSPEQVWQAIATGPGISSWFVPTTVEEREGGSTTTIFGPGMESVAALTRWDPPHSYVKEGEGMGPDSPPVATEWVVEAKSGGKCVVRVVHSWFASTDEWDGQWESVEKGWNVFFTVLRIKLENFLGQPASVFDATGMAPGSEDEVWAKLGGPFGLSNATAGLEARSTEGAPALMGKVAAADVGDERCAIVLISQPGPGIANLMAVGWGDQVYITIRFYLFGDDAASTAARVEPEWSRWLGERFPMGE